jgi:hypothetical protein
VSPFEVPPNTTTPDGAADQALAVSQATSEPAANTAQSAASTSTQLVTNAAVSQVTQQVSTAAVANPAATAATNQPWWVQFLESFFTIPTPTNPNGLNPTFFTVMFKNLTGFPYFGVGQGSFGYSIQQQLTFGVGSTAGAQGAWYPTPQFSGLAALGGGHPGGIAANLASSTKIGGLSVPSGWANAPGTLQESALKATTVNYITEAAGPTNNGVLQGMPPGAMGRRGATGFTHKYGFKRNVLIRPPSAG